MTKKITLAKTSFETKEFLDHISLDCVIFGFHDNELKVLTLQLKRTLENALPGGFLKKEETLEEAAKRVLKERTGLDQIFLKQFKVFSDPLRSKNNPQKPDYIDDDLPYDLDFFAKRFITIGYYALVDFTKVNATPDVFSQKCEWKNITESSNYILDHYEIIRDALEVLRLQLRHQPIGYNLLPDKFTMPELQKLYETILGRELDRRNFQRKILSYKILNKLGERKKGGAHKSPFLYEFNLEKYQKALNEGLSGTW
ncbi:NUDIX domain-containing protein [Prolixibacteraceae bacterium Z1-6]|uniref:NUDIX domain-containing protein n=1 Tax=Draconibacterium aestuarii TaxID=2998507 RepID=A0A9X3J6U8_9BACT|nr:NUDIX domain-containing protein [Prolixibacteraceae bacterium Z1-6]